MWWLTKRKWEKTLHDEITFTGPSCACIQVGHRILLCFVVCALCRKVFAPWALLVEAPLKVAPISACFESGCWVTLVSLSPGWMQWRICCFLSGWKLLFGIHASALRQGLCQMWLFRTTQRLEQAHKVCITSPFLNPPTYKVGLTPASCFSSYFNLYTSSEAVGTHCELPSRTPNQHRAATAERPSCWSRQWSRNRTCRR